MIRVQFNGKNNMLQAEFKAISSDVVQLTGEIPECTDGFKVYRQNGAFLGDYSAYTKIVGRAENGLQFGKK
jgi:hypothetical protein